MCILEKKSVDMSFNSIWLDIRQKKSMGKRKKQCLLVGHLENIFGHEREC